jgi:KDO2-lipid IV(A) lauroyltransferase
MKFFINFILIPLSKIFAGLPYKVQFMFAKALGFVWFDVIRLRRKLVIQNLTQSFPDWSMQKKISTGRQSVQHLCMSFFEYMIIYNYDKSMHSKYFELHNAEAINEQFRKGKGALLMTLHMGAIDFALVGFTGFGYKVNATLKRIKDVHIDKFVNDMRDKNGIKFIADRKNPFEIFRALKNNEALIFVMDQHMGRPHGIQVDFFGKKAWTAAGLAAFAIKTKMPVIPLYNFRRDDGKIVMDTLEPIELALTEDREQNIKCITQKYNDAIEKIIRLHPEQWLWVHRRWKD